MYRDVVLWQGKVSMLDGRLDVGIGRIQEEKKVEHVVIFIKLLFSRESLALKLVDSLSGAVGPTSIDSS